MEELSAADQKVDVLQAHATDLKIRLAHATEVSEAGGFLMVDSVTKRKEMRFGRKFGAMPWTRSRELVRSHRKGRYGKAQR